MIFAELRGKLGINSSGAHERSEDLLTSTVFGLARYLPASQFLLPLLIAARPIVPGGSFGAVIDATQKPAEFAPTVQDTMFWPNFGPFGEPDILLILRGEDGCERDRVIIEVKLFSGKSGEADDEDEPFAEDLPDPDQLVKYYQRLCIDCSATGAVPSLVYLTAHSGAPLEELARALRRLPSMRLFWLSWFDVYVLVEHLAKSTGNLIAADLAALLAHKGFKPFSGFRGDSFAAPRHHHFWTDSSSPYRIEQWFRHAVPQALAARWSGFWRS